MKLLHIFYGYVIMFNDNIDYGSLADELLVKPLISGDAYYSNITDFSALKSHSLLNRYNEFGLDKELINGYLNDYNVFLIPYVVQFEFRYQDKFISSLKDLSTKMSLSVSNIDAIKNIKDLRAFKNSCITFGDFSLSYINKEGWYGMSDVYWDFFEVIRLEHSSMISDKLNKMSSYLYFSFLDSSGKSIINLYSDFRDYSLTDYEQKPVRLVSKLLVNTKRHTFATYQVEPLSPMALSYYNRLFFLVKQNSEENHYAFVIFLNPDEISSISQIKIWACVDQ